MRTLLSVLLLTLFVFLPFYVMSEDDSKTTPMTNEGIEKHLKSLKLELEGEAGFWSLQIKNIPVQIITDPKADRMRIVAPIIKADELSKEQLYRLMQANFDSALDARYAITNEVVWSTYIHPLSPLDNAELESGLVQVLSLVATFGSTFSSTGFTFGGGDSQKESESEAVDIETI